MCRFSAPLCYNFLNIIHVDENHDKTVFSQQMRSMQQMPILGSHAFNAIFPAVLVLFCFGVLFNVQKRLHWRQWEISEDMNVRTSSTENEVQPSSDVEHIGSMSAEAGLLAHIDAPAQTGDHVGEDEQLAHEAEWTTTPLLRSRENRYRRERDRRGNAMGRRDRASRV